MPGQPQSITPADVVSFWRAAGPDRWFKKDLAFDAEISERFLTAHDEAAAGRLSDWEKSAEGALALLILLDQFPRNMFRGNARTFATDASARTIATRAIAAGRDKDAGPMRQFFYLPFMHSEALADQEHAVALYRDAGDSDGLKWANMHADIIRRFGRFPHRNAVLGRETTAEEAAFLDDGGFSG